MQGIHTLGRFFTMTTKLGNFLQSLALLALRLAVAKPFFLSGLTKIQSWPNTLMLFQHEYKVPVLPYEMAAMLGTATELALPIFLVLGLGARLPSFGLFCFNIVAVISYSHALSPAGINEHVMWGTILFACMAFGPGKLSADYALVRKNT